jgi:hypothetical protein
MEDVLAALKASSINLDFKTDEIEIKLNEGYQTVR